MSSPEGFTYDRRKNGDVVIFHHGRLSTVLRSGKASDFLTAVATDEPQELMARLTGKEKRGNERNAAAHPRNRQ